MKEVKDYSPSKDPRLIDCKNECGNDKCYARRYGLFAEKTCPNFVEPKLLTNADRIRAMTDEELAEYMSIYCCSHKTHDPRCQQFKDCGLCWLDWLKQEAQCTSE